MPWLPIYASRHDQAELFEYLNNSPDLAFIRSDGAGRWRAFEKLESWCDGRYCLWHTESGPLPLLQTWGKAHRVVNDPFEGWVEVRPGADKSQPYFGAGHPGIIWFNAYSSDPRSANVSTIGISSFEWIGNHYQALGNVAAPSTKALWGSLRRWVSKRAVKVPRDGPAQSTPAEIWAMSDALELFSKGIPGAPNPP
ncbi:hypothetical protein [Dyella choica]|uniref:Uncharacterized protein n=1 Tax=Dyella choica TaxID=1927959 RepID=A0A432MAT1_9GAMM|nr:hypothetical protein [Dyella choica]RUL78872.1 hypothetical protein EKH80_03460 [Dyella choica]